MDEIRHELCDKDKGNLQEAARALRAVGLGEFATHYYTHADGHGAPFFKVTKPYAKETEHDPDTVDVFLDVDHEFTVCAFFGHEHFDNADGAARLVRQLYDGTHCEVVIIFDELRIVAFLPNTGDPARNVEQMSAHVKEIFDVIRNNPLGDFNNAHFMFPAFRPYMLQVHQGAKLPVADSTRYLISIVFGLQPEYYL